MTSGRRRRGPVDKNRGRTSKPAARPTRVRSTPSAPPPATEPATATEEHPALAAYRARFPQDRTARWTGTQRPPIDYYVRLFDDPEFWADTYAYFLAVGDVTEQVLSHAAYEKALKEILEPFMKEILGPFRRYYHAWPPVEFLSVYYREGFSVMAGRWGVVPVFAWTREDEIKARVRTIHKKIGQTRRDAESEKRAALGSWLSLNGFTAADIASELGTPHAGERPRDPSTQRPIAGSEPPIDAWLRMSRKRMRQAQAALREAMRSPTSIEPLTDALTNLVRVGVFADANLEDLAAAVARLHDLLGVRPLL